VCHGCPHSTLLTCTQPTDALDGHGTGADGQPLVTLPDKLATVEYLDFSPPEREFYRAIFARTKARFDGLLAACVAPGTPALRRRWV
jgi:hypothetical protein